MIQAVRIQLDNRTWDRFEASILEAHKELKTSNPAKYQREVVDMLKAQKEPDYMPQYAAEKVKKKLNNREVADTPEMNKAIEKIIESKAEKDAEIMTDKKFTGFKKLTLGKKLNLTRRGKKTYEDAFKANLEKVKIKNKARYSIEAINELYNTNTSYELNNTRSFSELKERTNSLPFVMKDAKGKFLRTNKDNATEILATYFLRSSQ